MKPGSQCVRTTSTPGFTSFDVPVRWSRPLPSEPSSVTVIRDAAGRCFASFVIWAGPGALPETEPVIGIDLGLKHFAVLSDGRKIASPRFLRRAEKKLRRAQRALSRRQDGSRNRDKARLAVARAHARVADARRDFHGPALAPRDEAGTLRGAA
jgi:putative transposase